MEMVAVSKMKKAVARTVATRMYTELALALLVSLSREAKGVHPLLVDGSGDKTLVVIFASNKGLCGGFNVVLGKAVARFVHKAGSESVRFLTIGRNAERIARRLRGEVVGSFIHFTEEQGADHMRGLTRLILDEFESGVYRNVVVIYNDYVSAVAYRPIVRELLPVNETIIRNMLADLGDDEQATAPDPAMALKESARYLFEPNQAQLLSVLLPQLVEVTLHQAFLESLASEHSARMVAMRNATDNAAEMLTDLTLSFNHARQDSITQEISEIAAGANAMR